MYIDAILTFYCVNSICKYFSLNLKGDAIHKCFTSVWYLLFFTL